MRSCDPMDCSPPGSSVHEDLQAKNTGVGCHSILQEISQLKRSNPVSRIASRFFTVLATKGAEGPFRPNKPDFFSLNLGSPF